MRHLHRLLSSAAFAGVLLCAEVARADETPTGVWIDDQGRGGVEITDCAGKLCGHLVWFKEAEDAKNCGKQILGDVAPVGRNTWDNGWIYSPEKKQRFDVQLKPLSAGKLQVMGYAGMKFLSKTMIWTRAPADLKRCEAVKADAGGTAPAAKIEQPAPVEPPDERREAASPPDASPAPAGGEEASTARSKRTARADNVPADGGPREARRESRDADDDDDEPPRRDRKGDCTLNVPYVTLTFPCKD